MTARITDKDIDHLSWIYERMANKHGENTNCDYMHKLNSIIINLKLDYAYGEEPRTKESYEKVDGFSFALEADFNVGILFRPNELTGDGYLKCETEDDVAYAAANEMLFRKATKPIEWYEDAIEFASMCEHVDSVIASDDSLSIKGSMTRDQWCDFARILLEQGE